MLLDGKIGKFWCVIFIPMLRVPYNAQILEFAVCFTIVSSTASLIAVMTVLSVMRYYKRCERRCFRIKKL